MTKKPIAENDKPKFITIKVKLFLSIDIK